MCVCVCVCVCVCISSSYIPCAESVVGSHKDRLGWEGEDACVIAARTVCKRARKKKCVCIGGGGCMRDCSTNFAQESMCVYTYVYVCVCACIFVCVCVRVHVRTRSAQPSLLLQLFARECATQKNGEGIQKTKEHCQAEGWGRGLQ